MRTLHISAACGQSSVFNGIDHRVPRHVMVALITGDQAPDPIALRIIRYTGGTWENRVMWLEQRQAYGVWGVLDDDPNYGDTPADLDQRLRQALGGWGISLTVRRIDGTVNYQGTFVQALFDDLLAVTGKLN